jgi:ABC-2 type transport system ATP-binding protein
LRKLYIRGRVVRYRVVAIIHVDGLVKEFRKAKQVSGRLATLRTLFSREYTVTRAVNGIAFSIEPGEFVGYIGPNGAGKSTTIKMLTGILVPTSGVVKVANIVPWRNRERNARQIGIVFGQRTGLWWDLPLHDSLQLARTMYDIPRARFRANLSRFTDLLGLGEFIDTPVRQLSLGQRMRGDLAAAMLHEPQILYLDEPTVGLDTLAKQRIRSFLAELNRSLGTTVILTTHDLDDVEQLCTRIILIDQGKVLYDGDVATLKARHTPYHALIVRPAEPSTPIDVAHAQAVQRADGTVMLRFDPMEISVTDLIGSLLAAHQVSDLSIMIPDLEGVVVNIYADRSP